MLGKEQLDERYLNLLELKEIVEKRVKEDEPTYEQKVTYEYLKEFVKFESEVVEKLKELGLDERTVAKLTEIYPETEKEVKLVVENPDLVNQILDALIGGKK